MAVSLDHAPKGVVSFIAALSLAALVTACEPAGDPADGQSGAGQQTGAQSGTPSGSEIESESEKLNAFFARSFDQRLARSPVRKAYLGIRDEDYGKWDDVSDAFARESNELTRQRLEALKGFDFAALDGDAQLSYRLFAMLGERSLRQFQYRFHNYPVNQMRGRHTQIPSFLINIHRVGSPEDAAAYISRLSGVQRLMQQTIEGMEARQEMGILPPEFVFPLVLDAARNVITGAPFTDGEDSTLLSDFKGKVAKLDLEDEVRSRMIGEATAALLASVGPAYETLIAFLETQQLVANSDAGVWKFPDGAAYYTGQLANYTTTDLTADEIHQLGLDNVARIHTEMRAIMQQVGFAGSLPEFFAFVRQDKQFYHDNTDDGRGAYLDLARGYIDAMRQRLPDYFGLLPKAGLVVKRVEPFREKSAGGAFYQRPAMDGSRPGTYYVNLKNMANRSIFGAESLAYHEGLPGHHMQLAIAQELEGVPRFQRMARFTAYTEGWGLYSEYLGKDMGFYQDPYSDFGRLAAELWRACRLVVDTGLHAKHWTRQTAIDYLVENTPRTRAASTDAINRYIVMAGQATAYLIGKIKILELRQEAEAKLGEAFDIRAFHDEVLRRGPLPLNVLEEEIGAWVAAEAR